VNIWRFRSVNEDDKYVYRGLLGEVTYEGALCFFAWKNRILAGTYDTFTEAITALKTEADNPSSDP
jgi:hypothetical protein